MYDINTAQLWELGSCRTRTVGQWMKDENFEETRETKTAKLAEKNGSMHRTNHDFQTETTNV